MHLRPLPFAGVENYRWPGTKAFAAAPAMSVAREIKLLSPRFTRDKHRGGDRNDGQRKTLLPVHAAR
jgi:hypothetical protein